MTQDKKYFNKQYLKLKIRAFKLIQPSLQCIRCGCDDIRLLEINHKNGGGYREQKTSVPQGANFYHKIVKKRRSTDDIELLCRPCNAIHFLELKYNQKFPLRVVWD